MARTGAGGRGVRVAVTDALKFPGPPSPSVDLIPRTLGSIYFDILQSPGLARLGKYESFSEQCV